MNQSFELVSEQTGYELQNSMRSKKKEWINLWRRMNCKVLKKRVKLTIDSNKLTLNGRDKCSCTYQKKFQDEWSIDS